MLFRSLKMRGFAVDGQGLELAMRGDEQRAAGSFIGAARFHTYQAVFDDVRPPNAVLRGDFVESVQQIHRRSLAAVHGNRRAGFKADLDFRGLVRSFFGRGDPLPHGLVGRVGGIFEFAAFVAEVPNVAVAAVNVFLALLDGNVVLLRVGDGVFARIDVPLAPGRDDLHAGSDGLVRQFETHLVISLAGAAVREAVGAKLQRDFRLALGDYWPRHGGAEQVGVLVNGAGTKRRPNVVADKFFAQIFDVRGGGAGSERFLAGGFEVFLLANVADHGDDFATDRKSTRLNSSHL